MAALPDLITVEQYRQLPKGGEFVYELHNGEVVEVTRPKPRHWMLQRRLMDLLRPKLAGFGEVGTEIPYRALSEFDVRAADVAAISHARWKEILAAGDLFGAPELVVEVISPSNTRKQLRELVSLCLNNGGMECWLIDLKNETVTVMRKDGTSTVYRRGMEVSLAAFNSDSIAVASIFDLDA